MDFYLGMNIRAVGLLNHTGWRVAYYGFCFVCWLMIWWKPSLITLVGIGESALNLLLLITGLMIPVMSFISDVDSVQNASQVITIQGVINFLISGLICLFLYYKHMAALQKD